MYKDQLFKGGGQDVPLSEGTFVKMLSKEKVDFGQDCKVIYNW
jgi:hypothetical protein